MGENVSESGPDPFAEFEDWLVDGPMGNWPNPWDSDVTSSQDQQNHINSNVNLLADQSEWEIWHNNFETALFSISDEEARESRRKEYHFRLNGVEFEGPNLDFSATHFPCAVSFSHAKFLGNANFSEATFSGYASFIEVTFSGGAGFRNATFSAGAAFSNARFPVGAGFMGANFSEDAEFTNAKFSTNANFIDANFSANAYFIDAKFAVDADFKNANFSADAYFINAKFSKRANFIDAKFSAHAEFILAKFSADADFDNATFSADADFTNASFSADTIFKNANVGKTLYFNNLKSAPTNIHASGMVVGGSFYVNSHFHGEVNLERLEIAGTASFSGARFNVLPNLRDSKFDRPPEVAGMVVPAPKLKKDKWWHFARADDDKDVAKYRKLKAMALAANDHEKDGEFFSYEMLAKRGGETNTTAGLIFNTIYHWLSNFGQSFMLPLIWMLTSFISFAIAYDLVIGRMVSHPERMAFVWEHSFRNAVPLFTSLFKFGGRPDKHKTPYDNVFSKLDVDAVNTIMTLAFIQQFIGVVLLFLFLLALRNKFRLK